GNWQVPCEIFLSPSLRQPQRVYVELFKKGFCEFIPQRRPAVLVTGKPYTRDFQLSGKIRLAPIKADAQIPQSCANQPLPIGNGRNNGELVFQLRKYFTQFDKKKLILFTIVDII